MPDAPTLEPGSVFAQDYRVDRLMVEGAQGSIYAVEQVSTRRPRALKLMLPALVQSPEMRRRFEIEAHVGARIESDHVVEVIASGIDAQSGAPWLVMEMLDGVELGDHVVQGGPVPPGDVREIVGQLCHALGAAHRAGIVHRDLKPENVILSRPRQRGSRFMVKVIDFGVARMLVEAAKTAAATQSILGTPLWMAPEQVTPGVPIRPAADVWSLGLITYYLLTGRSFWMTAYEPEASIWRILNEVCVTTMPSASARAGEQECAELLPAGFDAWFGRCVDRDQDRRFADATEAYEALEALLPAPPRSSRTSSESLPGIAVPARSSRTSSESLPGVAAPPTRPGAPLALPAPKPAAAGVLPAPKPAAPDALPAPKPAAPLPVVAAPAPAALPRASRGWPALVLALFVVMAAVVVGLALRPR